MPTIIPTYIATPIGDGTSCAGLTWAAMANGDDGTPVEKPDYADRSVQVTGTFGAAGTLALEGSNDGTNYATLNDAQGNPIAITSASIKQIVEVTRYIRPRVTGGDGTTSLTATVIMRNVKTSRGG